MNEKKIQNPDHGGDRNAIERALTLLGAMTDDATAPELRSRIAEWFESPSGWDAKGEALEEFLHRTLTPDSVPDERTLHAKEEFLREVGAIPAETAAVVEHKAPFRRRIYMRTAAAAAVLFTGISGLYFGGVFHDEWFHKGEGENLILQTEAVIVATIEGIQKEIRLADGTMVWLHEKSNVTYRNNERHLEMEGKVWFDVAHDAASPFVVKTARMEILVHGTEFSVEQLEGSTVVKLIDGLLDVKLPSGKEERLYSGRQATLVWGTDQLVVEPFGDTPDWRTGHIFINGKTMPEIFRMTANFYDTDIRFDGSDFRAGKEYSINMNKTQSLENVLQVLSIISNGFTFERQSDGSVKIICVN